jgi:AMP deaminase
MDEFGVYQIYLAVDHAAKPVNTEGAKEEGEEEEEKEERRPLYNIPTLKQYFRDLDFILDVIADGPTKTFAFRRLKYLEAKWTMYRLLNEQKELADSKVEPESNVQYQTNLLLT